MDSFVTTVPVAAANGGRTTVFHPAAQTHPSGLDSGSILSSNLGIGIAVALVLAVAVGVAAVLTWPRAEQTAENAPPPAALQRGSRPAEPAAQPPGAVTT